MAISTTIIALRETQTHIQGSKAPKTPTGQTLPRISNIKVSINNKFCIMNCKIALLKQGFLLSKK